jgi:hypothetical protein
MSSRRKKWPVIFMPNDLFPGEDPDIRKEVADLVADPSEWLSTPNTRLGGMKPEDLIGTDREQLLRDLLRAVKYGMPT